MAEVYGFFAYCLFCGAGVGATLLVRVVRVRKATPGMGWRTAWSLTYPRTEGDWHRG